MCSSVFLVSSSSPLVLALNLVEIICSAIFPVQKCLIFVIFFLENVNKIARVQGGVVPVKASMRGK